MHAELRRVGGMNFEKRAGIEFVERGDLAGFGERVPLMLHATVGENERKFRIRLLGGRQEWPRQKLRLPGALGNE